MLSRKVIIIVKNYDELIEINHNPNWPYVLDHSYRILINVGSGSGKTNVSLNLIKNQRSDNNKIYLPIWMKVSITFNEREKEGVKKSKNKKVMKKSKKSVHWFFRNNWWCLCKFRRL